MRQSFVFAVGMVMLGGFAGVSYGSGCSPKSVVDDDAGPVCMESGTGCPCDPMTYKQKSCYEGPTGTLGPGRPCKSGTRKCVDGVVSGCMDQVLPAAAETCNMIDDDCNGKIDDIASNEPIITDFTDAGLDPPIEGGAQCYVNGQQGLCAAGRYGCNMQNMKDCLAIIKLDPDGGMSPYMEICNGLDDDCNGIVDDVNYSGQSCMAMYPDGGSPKGECANSTLSCTNGVEMCPPKAPTMETCNGKDDNCDGKIDNGACAMNGPYCCNYQSSHFCYPNDLGSPYQCFQ
jgi:hypothetical protein